MFIKKKARPGSSGRARKADAVGNGGSRRWSKHNPTPMKPSRPMVALEDLAAIYRADRFMETIETMMAIDQEILAGVPRSRGLTFEEFLAVCQAKYEIGEKEAWIRRV